MTQTDLDVSHCLPLSGNLIKHQTVCGLGRQNILANDHSHTMDTRSFDLKCNIDCFKLTF